MNNLEILQKKNLTIIMLTSCIDYGILIAVSMTFYITKILRKFLNIIYQLDDIGTIVILLLRNRNPALIVTLKHLILKHVMYSCLLTKCQRGHILKPEEHYLN